MKIKPTFDTLPEVVLELKQSIEELKALLLITQGTSTNDLDDPLTIQQASQIINLSVSTIYSLVQKSKIPYAKKGKKLYFSKAELTEWIHQGRRQTKDEIRVQAGLYISNRDRNRIKTW